MCEDPILWAMLADTGTKVTPSNLPSSVPYGRQRRVLSRSIATHWVTRYDGYTTASLCRTGPTPLS